MRKILYALPIVGLLLVLALVLTLAGFWYTPEPTDPSETESAGTETAAPTFPPETSAAATDPTDPISSTWTPLPMVSISMPVVQNHVTAEDGTVIFSHIFQDVVLDTGDADINETVTLDLLRRMDASAATVEQLSQAAVQAYAPGSDWTTHYFRAIYQPTRIDSRVLSLHGAESIFSGSEQAGHAQLSINYDLTTGSVLTLSQVLTEESGAADALCQALLAVLAEQADSLALFEDYAEVVTRRFQADLQQESSWHFSAEGLNFCFAPYDIAPHASGHITVTVPYNALQGIVRGELFPDGEDNVKASAAVQLFDGANLEDYTHFAELILNPDADAFLLTADSILYDVCLEQGLINGQTGEFEADATVFSANCLESAHALVIRADHTEDAPLLRLSYRAMGQTHRFFILTDADGNPQLTADE